MSKPKNNVNLQQLSGESGASDASDKPEAERRADEDGWAVIVTRGARARAAFASNLDKRDAAVAELKKTCRDNRLRVWGSYENQRSKLHYTHDDPACPNFGRSYRRAAGKLARRQLACGCNRQAAASRRALDLSVAAELAKQRGGMLLSTSYRNNMTPLHWMCAQGHGFYMSQSDAHRGRWCPHCAGSRANALCRVILERLLSVWFEPERTPPFLAKASKNAGLRCPLRFDGWCEAKRLAFEHQGLQHSEPVVRNNTEDGRPDIEGARRKCEQGKRYDAIKMAACTGQATLIVIPDISLRGYGYAQSEQVVTTIVSAVRHALPTDSLGKTFEHEVKRLRTLSRRDWERLIQPVFAGTSRIARLREHAAAKGGRVVAVTDDNTATFECSKGHRWTAQINNVLGGTWCPREGVELRARTRRLSVPALNERLKGIGLQLAWTDTQAQSEYKNNMTPIPVIRSACGGRFSRPLAKLHAGTRCPGCKGRRVCNGIDVPETA